MRADHSPPRTGALGACLSHSSSRVCPPLYYWSRNTTFLLHPLTKFKYCGDLRWPRGSVFGFSSLGIEFRILCLDSKSSDSSYHLLAEFSLYARKGLELAHPAFRPKVSLCHRVASVVCCLSYVHHSREMLLLPQFLLYFNSVWFTSKSLGIKLPHGFQKF